MQRGPQTREDQGVEPETGTRSSALLCCLIHWKRPSVSTQYRHTVNVPEGWVGQRNKWPPFISRVLAQRLAGSVSPSTRGKEGQL